MAILDFLKNYRAFQAEALQCEITCDRDGVPFVRANSWDEFVFGMGVAHARARAVQMITLKRRNEGRLAEFRGEHFVEADRLQRILNITSRSRDILSELTCEERRSLVAYSLGTNIGLKGLASRAQVYCAGLGTTEWNASDCVSVALSLYQDLSGDEINVAMHHVVREAVDPQVYRFFFSGESCDVGHADGQSALLELLAAHLAQRQPKCGGSGRGIYQSGPGAASNAFAISTGLSGGALLANDIHLSPRFPAHLFFVKGAIKGRFVAGFTFPGMPLILTGTNGRVAWGITNSMLHTLRLEPLGQEEGKSNVPVETREECIRVRGAPSVMLVAEDSKLGPVAPHRLLGRKMIWNWDAFRASAVNFALASLWTTESVHDAIDILRTYKGPPLVFHVADRDGAIGRVVSGSSSSEPLSEPVSELRTSGHMFINANHDFLNSGAGTGNFHPPHRCRQISRLLCGDGIQGTHPKLDEQAAWDIQFNADVPALDPYVLLVRRCLKEGDGRKGCATFGFLLNALDRWNGSASPEDWIVDFLWVFRGQIVERILTGFFGFIRELEPRFVINQIEIDPPILWIINNGSSDLIPCNKGDSTWDSWLFDALAEAWRVFCAERAVSDADLRLGALDRGLTETGPVRGLVSKLWEFAVGFPSEALSGHDWAVRVASPHSCVAGQLVINPIAPESGLWSMPFAPRYGLWGRIQRHWFQQWRRGKSQAII